MDCYDPVIAGDQDRGEVLGAVKTVHRSQGLLTLIASCAKERGFVLALEDN